MEAYEEEYASKLAHGEPETPMSPYDSMDEDYTSQDDMDIGDSSEVQKHPEASANASSPYFAAHSPFIERHSLAIDDVPCGE